MFRTDNHILIVDDEPLVRRSLSEVLTLEGYAVSSAKDGQEALEMLDNYNADVVITDIKMPHMDGLTLLKKIRERSKEVAIILMTGYGSIENAVEVMKDGAADYITKPIIDSEIKLTIKRILEQRKVIEENKVLKETLKSTSRLEYYGIIGKNAKMQKIYNLIDAISDSRATVVVRGESGTGKRVIAHAIHNSHPKSKHKPFVEVSCGALPETLLESELFGHVKGAFTGAHKDRIGRFEVANGGTILLDEIDAFSPALQVKLLRVLQEGEFERVGDTKTIKVDVRVIAATNQNLEEAIKNGKFRQDLYYRLNIINIDIPTLKERTEDIPLLVDHFIKKHSKHTNRKIESVDETVFTKLAQYSWPGNVRELENVIERALILSKGPTISVEDLPDILHNGTQQKQPELHVNGIISLKDALKIPEKNIIIDALERTNWNRNETAKALGINRTTLYKKMSEFGLLNDTIHSDGRSHRFKEVGA